MPIAMPVEWTAPTPTVKVAHRETIRSTDPRYSTREIEFSVVVEFTPRHERNSRIVNARWIVRRLLDGLDPLGTLYNSAIAKSKKEAESAVDEYVNDKEFRGFVQRELAHSAIPFGRTARQ